MNQPCVEQNYLQQNVCEKTKKGSMPNKPSQAYRLTCLWPTLAYSVFDSIFIELILNKISFIKIKF